MQVAGKVVVVTGGANGIGRALCEAFHRAGAAKVIVADLDLSGAEAVVAEVGKEGVGVAGSLVGADRLRGLGFESLQPVQRGLRLFHLWKRRLRQILAPLTHPLTMAQSAVG